MVKVKLLGSSNAANFQDDLNQFIADKKIIDIKYQAITIPTSFRSGVPSNIGVFDRALVIYEELGPDELRQAIQEMQNSGRAFAALHQALQKED